MKEIKNADTKTIIKNTKKNSGKKHVKDVKIFEDKKDKGQKKIRDRYQNLSAEEKVKKRQYHHEHSKNLFEEQKQKQVEYMRNYYLAHRK